MSVTILPSRSQVGYTYLLERRTRSSKTNVQRVVPDLFSVCPHTTHVSYLTYPEGDRSLQDNRETACWIDTATRNV